MAGFSIWHWLIVLIWLFVVGFPVARILGRLGYSRWWTVLAFFPLVNLICLWLLAFAQWPRLKEAGDD